MLPTKRSSLISSGHFKSFTCLVLQDCLGSMNVDLVDLSMFNIDILNKVDVNQGLLDVSLSSEVSSFNMVEVILPFGEIGLFLPPLLDLVVALPGSLGGNDFGIMGKMFKESLLIIILSGLSKSV